MRRVLRVTGKVLLIAVCVLALLVGGTWMFLQTRWGGETVRRLALPRVNAALAGRVELRRFAFGGDRVTLDDLVLRDPDGAIVGSVERVELAFFPFALLRGRVEVRALDIRRPDLQLVADSSGSNLSRALASRRDKPRSAAPSGDRPKSETPTIDIRRVAIADGNIGYRNGSQRIHLTDLGMRAAAHLAHDRLRLAAEVQVEGGRINVDGEIDLKTFRAPGSGLVVRGQGIDLAKLMDGLPKSDLAFEVRGQNERYELAHLLATLPGVDVTGGGTVTTERADLRVRVVATDLGAAARGVTIDRQTPLVLAGKGRLDIAVEGPFAAPALRVSGEVPNLRVGSNRASGLTFRAAVPNLRAPAAVDLDVDARLVALGERTIRSLAISVRGTGARLSARVRAAAPAPLALDATGHRDPSSPAVVLDTLALRYPDAAWSLVRPARIEMDGDRLSVENLALRADGQRIAIDLRRTERTQRGRVTIANLDLARLPRALVPAAMGLGGRVDLDARLAGPTDAPEIDVKLSLADGRLRGHRGLAVELDARLAKARGRGRLDARGLGTAITARFDLPAAWPLPNRQTPLHLQLDLAETDLAALTKAIDAASGRSPASGADRVRGRVRLSARLDGTPDRPRLTVEAGGRGLAVGHQNVGDINLSLQGDGERPVTLKIDATTIGGAPARSSISIETALSLRTLFRRMPSTGALLRTPFEVHGDIDRLPLSVLGKVAGYPSPVGGTLSAKIAVSGTAAAPKGNVGVDVTGATTGRFPPTDARLELDFERRAIETRARVIRKGRPLLAVVARLGTDLAALRHPEALGDAPIQVRAVLGPLALARLGLPPESDREPPRALKGRLHADLTVDGTLAAPRAVAHVHAEDIRLDKSLIGVGRLELTYADRKVAVDAQLRSANGGTMHAVITTKANLGYPAVIRGLDVRKLPFDARLEAKHFDVQGLSGATQQLRTVAGLVDAVATLRGTIADPRLEGRLEWSQGLLAVTGFGEYRDIHLALHGSQDKLVLDDLAAKSGAGSARLTGDATHSPGGYRFAAKADLKRFPVYKEGQALANVTLASQVSGTAAPFDSKIAIGIDQARIELSEAKRKRLQGLEVPPDVVLVEDGKPLNPAQAKRLEALKERQRRQQGVEPARGPQRTGSETAPALEIRVTAPRQLWVTGKDAYMELGLSRSFRIQKKNDDTQIFGRVIVHRGRIDVMGRRFDVQADSTLRWTGPSDRPELDVRAIHKNEQENVTVLLTAKGPLDRLTIAVTSPNRPELTESQLYTLIITGRLQLAGGTSGSASASAQGASLLGGVLASQLQKTLGKKLPLDVLTISAGSDGLRGTQLEAGRYISDKIYVGYVGRVGADPLRYQNRNAVHLEYQLTNRWEVEGEYGDVGTGTVDLMWKKNY